MNIAIAFNEKYIPYAYVMLTSLFENNKHRDITVYMLYQDISDEALAVFEGLEEKYGQSLYAIEVSQKNILDTLPHTDEWTIEVYYRLMLQDLLPETVDRVLYLDIDVIVNGQLDGFYDVDFEDAYLAVNRDMSEAAFGLVDQQVALFSHHGVDPKEFPYFNAGIMLMNIEKIRQEYDFYRFIEEFNLRRENIFAQEQDLLNDLFFGKVKFVDENKYDLFAKVAFSKGLGHEWVKENVAIIHFAGGKPWDADSFRYSTEKLWWDYAKLTPLYFELMEKTFIDEMTLEYADKTIRQIAIENEELTQLLLKVNNYINSLENK